MKGLEAVESFGGRYGKVAKKEPKSKWAKPKKEGRCKIELWWEAGGAATEEKEEEAESAEGEKQWGYF